MIKGWISYYGRIGTLRSTNRSKVENLGKRRIAFCVPRSRTCIYGLSAGGAVEVASIERDAINAPDQAGRVTVNWANKRQNARLHAGIQIQVLLAGPVAEMIHLGERLHPATVREWQGDWMQAYGLAKAFEVDEPKRQKLLERLCASTLELMSKDNCWQAISEIADLLEAHETIDGDEVREIVTRWVS